MELNMSTDITPVADVNVEGTEPEQAVKSDLTPYSAFKVTNIALVRAGIDDVKVTPQAMYSRAAKGIITSYRDSDDKVWFDGEAFAAWLAKFVAGYVNGGTSAARTDFEALADEYLV
jgi:hypothetical protein